MPAGLTDSDSMFSVRVTPWHGLGAVLDRPPASVGEAIEASGLGWSVAKEPMAIHRGGSGAKTLLSGRSPRDLRRARLPDYISVGATSLPTLAGLRRASMPW